MGHIHNKDPEAKVGARHSKFEDMFVKDWEKEPGFEQQASDSGKRKEIPYRIPRDRLK